MVQFGTRVNGAPIAEQDRQVGAIHPAVCMDVGKGAEFDDRVVSERLIRPHDLVRQISANNGSMELRR